MPFGLIIALAVSLVIATLAISIGLVMIVRHYYSRPSSATAGDVSVPGSVWRQPDSPFWWPNAQGFAIMSINLICGAALFARMGAQSNIDDKMLDTMITVMFTSCLVGTYQYLFGSSRGSTAKDDTQNKIVERALATPPVVVAPAAAVLTPSQVQGEATLKNGELTYFRTIPDEDTRLKFLAMTAAERAAAIATAKAAGG